MSTQEELETLRKELQETEARERKEAKRDRDKLEAYYKARDDWEKKPGDEKLKHAFEKAEHERERAERDYRDASRQLEALLKEIRTLERRSGRADDDEDEDRAYCEKYPDIHAVYRNLDEYAKQLKDKYDLDEREQLIAGQRLENQRADFYEAVRDILATQFDFAGAPLQADDFPGTLAGDDAKAVAKRAKFVAVYGQVLAKGFTSPSLGKTRRIGDDRELQSHAADKHRIVIDRRFSDAVLAAHQDYSANEKLYRTVFTFLQEQGEQPTPPHNGSSVATARSAATATRSPEMTR